MTCYSRIIPGKIFLYITLFFITNKALSQAIPSDRFLDINELQYVQKDGVRDEFKNDIKITSKNLAAYFRKAFSERYFYDYHNFHDRLKHYNQIFENQENHKSRALDHLAKHNDSTQWILPFNYLNGEIRTFCALSYE